MPDLAWVNGKFVEPAEPSLGVRERGFLYGDGLFETIRVRGCRPLCWKEHLERLRHGCAVLRIDLSLQLEQIRIGVREIAHRLGNGALRLTVTRGQLPGRGLLPIEKGAATAVITASAGEPYPAQRYRRGFKAHLISFPRSHLSPLVKLKTTNSLENILGRLEADAAGADEGIFLNYRGEVTEGTVSNLFLVIRGKLLTPPPECGLLPGIMRARILLLAEKLGLPVGQAIIAPRDFAKAEEAFLTNALMEVMPLVFFNRSALGDGSPGALTGTLRRELEKWSPGPDNENELT